jgi:peptidoglycan hydrolase FlgJ
MSDAANIAAAQSALASRAIAAPAGKTDAQMHAAAKEFAAQFMGEMLNMMNEDLPTDGPFDGGEGEGMVRSLLNDQYAKAITDRGGVGLSNSIYQELVLLQEKSHAGASAQTDHQ